MQVLEKIKVIYDNIFILKNEDGINKLGFKNYEICEKFTQMISIYAKELYLELENYQDTKYTYIKAIKEI